MKLFLLAAFYLLISTTPLQTEYQIDPPENSLHINTHPEFYRGWVMMEQGA